jgi:hypothetical protein
VGSKPRIVRNREIFDLEIKKQFTISGGGKFRNELG